MNPYFIKFDGFGISWYSVCILIGIALASFIMLKESKKFNIKSDFIYNLIFWCVILGVLGARIYYVIFNLDYYLSNPMEIIKIWEGGLAIHGGIIAGFITLVYFCKKNNIRIFRITDIVVPGLIIGQALGRWGNFFNQEAHGGIVSKSFLEAIHLPRFIINGMEIGGSYYHPTFLYESIFCIIGFLILILYRRYHKNKLGNLTSIYLVWYGFVRFFIESLRTDSLMLGSLKMAQIVSIIMIIIGAITFVITWIKFPRYNELGDDKNAK